MRILIIVLLAVHVLAGVFWAGSTFALARAGGEAAARLFRPQMGAATLASLLLAVTVVCMVTARYST